MWSLFLVEHLYLSGVWLQVKNGHQMARVIWVLFMSWEYMSFFRLNYLHNLESLGSLQERESSLWLTPYNFCISSAIFKLKRESTFAKVYNAVSLQWGKGPMIQCMFMVYVILFYCQEWLGLGSWCNLHRGLFGFITLSANKFNVGKSRSYRW